MSRQPDLTVGFKSDYPLEVILPYNVDSVRVELMYAANVVDAEISDVDSDTKSTMMEMEGKAESLHQQTRTLNS